MCSRISAGSESKVIRAIFLEICTYTRYRVSSGGCYNLCRSERILTSVVFMSLNKESDEQTSGNKARFSSRVSLDRGFSSSVPVDYGHVASFKDMRFLEVPLLLGAFWRPPLFEVSQMTPN